MNESDWVLRRRSFEQKKMARGLKNYERAGYDPKEGREIFGNAWLTDGEAEELRRQAFSIRPIPPT